LPPDVWPAPIAKALKKTVLPSGAVFFSYQASRTSSRADTAT
jgi:hypothetical protein